jgi:hypothetical protein
MLRFMSATTKAKNHCKLYKSRIKKLQTVYLLQWRGARAQALLAFSRRGVVVAAMMLCHARTPSAAITIIGTGNTTTRANTTTMRSPSSSKAKKRCFFHLNLGRSHHQNAKLVRDDNFCTPLASV